VKDFVNPYYTHPAKYFRFVAVCGIIAIMRYWELAAPGQFEQKENTSVSIPDGYAKVKIQMVSVSPPDISAYSEDTDNYPVVLGRSAVGFVSEADENDRMISRGQRVAINPHVACSACYACKNGRPSMCENAKVLGINMAGLLGDFAVIPIRNLYPLPPQVKSEDALNVEPLAIACRIFCELNMEQGSYAAIFGATRLGILTAQLLMYQQVIPIVIGSREENLECARRHGIYYTINSGSDNAAQISRLTGGRLCEYSVYIPCGDEKPQDAVDAVMHGGTVILTGYTEPAGRANIKAGAVFHKQLKVVGINNGCKQIESAINLIAKKEIDMSVLPIIETSFEDFPEKFKEYVEGGDFLSRLIVRF